MGYFLKTPRRYNMKKEARIDLVPILIGITSLLILVFIGVFFTYGLFSDLFSDDPISYANRVLDIRMPKGTTVTTDIYEKPSFPTGDGHSWIILQIPSGKVAEFEKSLKSSSKWKPLPLSSNLIENEQCLQPSNMFGVKGEIPTSGTEGYYFFSDWQANYNKSKKEQIYDTSIPLCKRPSLNILFSLFDTTDNKLYIWKIDT
jgi:hypothetical protein